MILTQNSRTLRIYVQWNQGTVTALHSWGRGRGEGEGEGEEGVCNIIKIMFWNLTNYLNYLLFMRVCSSKNRVREIKLNPYYFCRQNCKQKMINNRQII
jgi:hypothetical protein